MQAGIANRLVPDSIDFVPDDGMHGPAAALHCNCELDGTLEGALFAGAFEGLSEFVPFDGSELSAALPSWIA